MNSLLRFSELPFLMNSLLRFPGQSLHMSLLLRFPGLPFCMSLLLRFLGQHFHVNPFQRFLDALSLLCPTDVRQRYVLFQGQRVQGKILGQQRHMAVQGLFVQFLQVPAVIADLSLFRAVYAQQQLDQGGLAASVDPYQETTSPLCMVRDADFTARD